MNIKILISIFVFTGIFLLGTGITGYVISETCCLEENCSKENKCNFEQTELNQNFFSTLAGILFLVFAIIYFIKNNEV